MGFNLGAFLGGAARGGSQVLDERRAQADRDKVTKEERQWQLATENRANARAKKARRASDAKALEEQIGTMVALGMPADAARAVAKNGVGAMKVAIGDLKYGRENGVNAASYYTMGQKGLLQGDPSTAIKAAEPAGLAIDSEGIRSMYGAVDEDYTSHNEQIRAITNKQLNLTPDSDAFKQLQTQREALYTDLAAIAGAKDTSDGEDARLFTTSSVVTNVASARAAALANYDVSMNIETSVRTNIDGKGVQINIADLDAANFLDGTAGKVGDPFMNHSIVTLRTQAQNKLQSIAFAKISADPDNVNKTVTEFSQSPSATDERNLVEGQIIKIPATDDNGQPKPGVFKRFMWTGIPNPSLDGRPYVYLFEGA